MSTGGTMRDHYAVAAKRRGFLLPEHMDLPLPAAVAHLMEWFGELNQARGSTGFGMAPISYSEMEAWARLRDLRLTPFEAQALKDLDVLYLASLAKKGDEVKPKGAGDGR